MATQVSQPRGESVAPLIPKTLIQMGMQAVKNNNGGVAAAASESKPELNANGKRPQQQEESVTVSPEVLYSLMTGKRYFKTWEDTDRAARFLTNGKFDTKSFVKQEDLKKRLGERYQALLTEKVPHLDPANPGLEWIWQRMTPEEFQELEQRSAGNNDHFRGMTVERGLDFFIADLQKRHGNKLAIISPLL